MVVRRMDPEGTKGMAQQIDVSDSRAVTFWSRRFGITPQQLRRAVKQVGPDSIEIALYLGKPACAGHIDD
jgi:hypothetical protein